MMVYSIQNCQKSDYLSLTTGIT